MTRLIQNSKLFRKLSVIVLSATLTAQSFAGSLDTKSATVEPNVPSIRQDVPSSVESLSTRDVYSHTLKAITLIHNKTNDSIGTGWIVDMDRRLIVTNQHVINGATEVSLAFPVHKDGELQTDLASLKTVEPVPATVIDSVTYADLAIIQAESLPADAHALELADSSVSPGQRVHAVGGRPQGSFGLWKYSVGFVSLVSKTDFATGTPIRVMQSNIDINPGNSGGPIVNDYGKVVGVCQSIHTQARDVSYNVDLSELVTYLDTVLPLIDNDSPEALVELGRRNRKAKRPQTALQYLSRALQADPTMIDAQVERGWAFLSMGDKVTAINDFTAAINKQPNLAQAYHGRGEVYYAMKDYDKAISDYSMAIANDPTNANLYNNRALAQEMNEDFQLAVTDYTQAIRLDGSSAVFLTNRGDLFSKMKEYRKAVSDFDRALKISPNYAWANNEMGLALHALKEFKDARPYLLKACELEPNNAKYIRDFGETLQSLSEHKLALNVWSMAIEKDSEHAYSYYSRAWSLHKLNNDRAALQDMNVAIKLDGERAYFFAFRGKVLKALGESEASKADYARAAQLDPQTYAETANNNSSNNNTPDRRETQDNRNVSNNHPLEGRWYVKTMVDGRQLEMTQTFYDDGRYECLLLITTNGETKRTEEQGHYRLAGNQIEFDTNLGKYTMDCKMEDGMFWLLFQDLGSWIGSVRR